MKYLAFAQALLEEMNRRYPPTAPARHALMLNDTGGIILSLSCPTGFRDITFEPQDLTMTLDELVTDIERARAERARIERESHVSG